MKDTNIMFTEKDVLEYHLGGKIGLNVTKPLLGQRDLSIAYTPGVSFVCEAIKNAPEKDRILTSKANLVAVITDGSAVLGLGNIGPRASIPVMEGKAVLFKAFAGVDGWPLPIEHVSGEDGTPDVEKFIETVRRVSCMFGGINLEDIAAPACFEIEERLDSILDIPVFHDDQWGTAIITLAALKNYCLITRKELSNIKVLINGAGAAGLRIADMLKTDGVENCVICDSKGLLTDTRDDINKYKARHAVSGPSMGLAEAIKGADVFIGVSVGGCLDETMVMSMASDPAIFAMANPVPEILPEKVSSCMKGRSYVMATGRSDYPNQINNVLGFPFIFRGALDVRATRITMGMKVAASRALAELAREGDVPVDVRKAYNRDFEFGRDYLIPTPFDSRLRVSVSLAVAEAAISDGVAKREELPEYATENKK